MQSSCDLVIIGAGAAGLAAARAARDAGLNIEVVEAASRIGGRGYTDLTTFPAPFDLGCQWLHAATINPYTKAADRLGFRYRKSNFNYRIHDGKWWLNERLVDEFGQSLAATYDRIAAAGAAGDDGPAARSIDPADDWAPLFRRAYTGYMAWPPEEVSTYDTSRFHFTDEDWPVEDGYGALIAAEGADIEVNLDCPVKSIDWGSNEVMVGTARGMIFCRAVLVTVSIAVLKAERIKFFPLLPDWKLDALDRLQMGHAEKAGFWLKRDIFAGMDPHFAMLNWEDAPTAGFLCKPFDRPMVTMFASGPFARDLFAQGSDAAIAEARSLLTKVFGADIQKEIVTACATNWVNDPYILGAYSVLSPHGGEARAELAQPIENRVFFAGEAASSDGFSTAHGAYNSGMAAVDLITKALK
ncbi:flavin monoamine oxidase family protein [Dongia rigui]|uniref:Tryptophan 2-monooxygenase n=1 Tax=Dongia rigui TaxID=940149 RepID=A0ABU5DYV4_9PROT|nr:NAD(P)/FAD-dependent oxidoreductase [Dongia rigui]MDY0871741.1 NAD(P)/FAD-dependent oxidoreductase [Dongia rigui]